jgi:dual specificity protein kinase YAK1
MALQAPPSSGGPDPKRPYGGLVPSQPKGTRAYQDAATYNHHLAQHQAYTAQAQAASQAANTFRNPYITPQNSQQQASSSFPIPQDTANAGYPQQLPQHHPQYPASQPAAGHRGLTHQSSAGQLSGSNSVPQYTNNHASGVGLNASAHLNPNVPTNSYYPNSRARANTINQMDAVPPALARLQHMNQDVIAGRNALTPVLNRDDAMREWERRQSGKPSAAQPYPQLEFLQQQAEMAAASGLTGWGQPTNSNRYPPPPSKLAHSYHPQTIVVDEDNNRRDAVMSNVRSAARSDGANAMYGSSGVISSPAQTYTSNATTSGNRYAATYSQPQQSPTSSFDSIDRRTDIGNLFVPMQPDQYQSYPNPATSSTSSRHVVPPAQTVAPSFYGAGVVSAGQSAGGGQQRNPFSASDASQQPMSGAKDVRRGTGMDVWPR